jgi:hypothetical protein
VRRLTLEDLLNSLISASQKFCFEMPTPRHSPLRLPKPI